MVHFESGLLHSQDKANNLILVSSTSSPTFSVSNKNGMVQQSKQPMPHSYPDGDQSLSASTELPCINCSDIFWGGPTSPADINSLNSTAEATTGYTTWQATLIGLSAGLLSVVTIAGNLMVMISFKMDKQLQTISNYFLFSLAVADMIIGLVSMPLFTANLIHKSWPFGVVMCDAWLSIDYLASQTSVLNLLVIRYYIIRSLSNIGKCLYPFTPMQHQI